MTPAQLDRLAEQADFAAGFYAVTNPAVARRFAETAATARSLSEQLDRRQQLTRLRTELEDIRERLDRRTRTRQALDPPSSHQAPTRRFR
jgi:hypothetical protein